MEKWTEIFENEELTKKLIAQTPEEVQKTLAEAGYEVTADEILAVGNEINAAVKKAAATELGEADLDEVAGGAYNFKTGFVVGAVVAAGIILGW